MKAIRILCIVCLTLFTNVYPEVLTTFPDMVKPIELRIDGGYIYITDQYSFFAYDINTLNLVKKLCNRGEGPGEFRTPPRISFTSDRLILYDAFKIIIYSKDFKFLKEIKSAHFIDRVNPIDDNYILSKSSVIDKKKYRVFSLYNSELEKIKDLVVEPEDQSDRKFFINPWPGCRSRNDKVFIAQPKKGFYIDVFDKHGNKLYTIVKEVKKIKSEEKHKKHVMEEIRYFVGRERFEKAKVRGAFNKPMREFIPSIKNFWVVDNRIYVKTFDITDTKEKYIVMDVKGKVLKKVFLPKTYMELLTFSNNKFYYLYESEDDEEWVLCTVKL